MYGISTPSRKRLARLRGGKRWQRGGGVGERYLTYGTACGAHTATYTCILAANGPILLISPRTLQSGHAATPQSRMLQMISRGQSRYNMQAYLKVRPALLVGPREVDVGVWDTVRRSEVPRRCLPAVQLVLQRLFSPHEIEGRNRQQRPTCGHAHESTQTHTRRFSPASLNNPRSCGQSLFLLPSLCLLSFVYSRFAQNVCPGLVVSCVSFHQAHILDSSLTTAGFVAKQFMQDDQPFSQLVNS